MSYKKLSLDEQIDQDYQDYLDRQIPNTNIKEVKHNERKLKAMIQSQKDSVKKRLNKLSLGNMFQVKPPVVTKIEQKLKRLRSLLNLIRLNVLLEVR